MNKALSILGFTFLLLIGSESVTSCTCCVYFNHFFNAEKAFKQGEKLRQTRFDSIPDDSLWSTKEENEKFDRVITKCSNVLELYPQEIAYKPRVLFLTGMSFYYKGVWKDAIRKFDEYEKYFPEDDSIPAAQYYRAYSYYKNHEDAMSRFALESVLKKEHPYHVRGLELLANLEEDGSFDAKAIESLEKLLATTKGNTWLRAKARFRLGKLYFKAKKFKLARKNLKASEIEGLSLKNRYDANLLSIQCLIELKEIETATQEMKSLLNNRVFESFRFRTLIEYARILLEHSSEKKVALNSLLEVTSLDSLGIERSEAWFLMGNFEQFQKQNLLRAKQHYDSCVVSFPSGKWAQTAKERSSSISRLATMRDAQKKGKLNTEKTFRMAELFLFDLDEVDSALQTLDSVVSKNDDSLTVMRAAYARAFIYDEYKKDKSRSDSLYQWVLDHFPKTDFARQAQINLGIPVTVRLKNDEAHDAFLEAESLYTAVKELPSDSMQLVDSLYSESLNKYDSVEIYWPGTEYAARALYAHAFLLETEVQNMDSAKVIYQKLKDEYIKTPYGQIASAKLAGKIKITQKELDQLKQHVEQVSREADRVRASRKYQEKLFKKRREKADEEELLEYDYDKMYDF